MRHPDGAHTHGSSFDWRLAAVVAVIGALATGGGASGLFAGIEELLIWVASVLTVAAAGGAYLVIRAMRRSGGHTYIRSVHGPTHHELVIAENREMRRQLADIRAMRRQMAAAETLGVAYRPPVVHADVIEG